MANERPPKLHLGVGFDDNFAHDVRDRGWLDGVTVEFDGGAIVPVSFYDPIRLVQDLAENTKLGRPYVAEKNMIVLNEITPAAIEAAVARLAKEGYFSELD